MLRSEHRIDIVIEDQNGLPIVLIEPKCLKYRKHNWDKGSRLIAGHYNLKKTFRSIRKSIGILAGKGTETSIGFLRRLGVEVYRIPFSMISDVLGEYHIPYAWKEKDENTPKKALELFRHLPAQHQQEIGEKIVQSIKNDLIRSINNSKFRP